MTSKPIEEVLSEDLTTFLQLKEKDGHINSADALEIGAYVAANYLRMIYTRNKSVTEAELNGVFGLISNFYNVYFENQLTHYDYEQLSKKALELLRDTDFDKNSRAFFQDIVAQSGKKL